MELQQLRYFATVARLQNITAASKELYMAQSALSQSMMKLENDLGVTLFMREGKKIRLSKAGEELERRVHPILAEIDNIKPILTEVEKGYSTVITILMPHSPFLIPNFVASYSQKYPQVNLEFHRYEDLPYFDFKISANPPKREDSIFLVDLEFCVVVPISSRLAERDWVDLKDVKDAEFILPVRAQKGSTTREFLDSEFGKIGFVPNVRYEVENYTSILQMITMGLGVGLAPRRSQEAHPRLRYIPVRNPELHRQLYLAWKKGFVTRAMHDFIEFAVEYFGSYVNKSYGSDEEDAPRVSSDNKSVEQQGVPPSP